MKVLLASDGSDNAIEAAKFLRRMQFGRPIELTLVSVCYDPQSTGAEVIQPWFPEWLEKQQAAFEAHHRELESMLSECCSSVQKILRDGHAARVILSEADATGADLIVMGARGHSTVGRMLLGSTSDSVATHARCSVLVVHPDPEGGHDETMIVPSVVLAYDGSSASREALDGIRDLALPDDTPLNLVSISPIFDYMLGEGLAAVAVENEQAVNESMRQTLDEVCDGLHESFASVSGIVEKGRHVGDSLVTAVETLRADLLVIGDAGHSLLHDWILGSTTKYVLRHASCSVWLSRHHRRSPAESDANG